MDNTDLFGLLRQDGERTFIQTYAAEGARDYHAARITNAVAFLHRDAREIRWIATTNTGRRLPDAEQTANACP